MTNTPAGNEKLNARLKRGTRQVFIWTLAWLISTAAIAFGPKLLWDFNHVFTLIAYAAKILLGIKMLIVNKHHLDDMDEMQQKVHYNAIAVSFGVTMLFGVAYGLLEPAGLLSDTPQPSNILFVMGISYIVAVFVNFRKYL